MTSFLSSTLQLKTMMPSRWSCCQNRENTVSNSHSPTPLPSAHPSWEPMVITTTTVHSPVFRESLSPSDITFGYEGQPTLFEHLDFGISMESRGGHNLTLSFSNLSFNEHAPLVWTGCLCSHGDGLILFFVHPVAIVGPNGIGKSSFLNLLLGKLEPVSLMAEKACNICECSENLISQSPQVVLNNLPFLSIIRQMLGRARDEAVFRLSWALFTPL